jgi:hypothetical protein
MVTLRRNNFLMTKALSEDSSVRLCAAPDRNAAVFSLAGNVKLLEQIFYEISF